MGCAKAKRFPRTVIEFIHDLFDFLLGDGCQIPVFREVLSDETVGILVQSTLPGSIRMRKADPGIKVGRHAFMVGELATIVIGKCVQPVFVRSKMKRVFKIDVEMCRVCGGSARVIACIEDPVVIKKILVHLQEKPLIRAARLLPDSRASPQSGLFG